jgi:hypothetical protein
MQIEVVAIFLLIIEVRMKIIFIIKVKTLFSNAHIDLLNHY